MGRLTTPVVRDKKIPLDRMTERVKQMKDANESAAEQCLIYDRNFKVPGSSRKYFGGWTPPKSS